VFDVSKQTLIAFLVGLNLLLAGALLLSGDVLPAARAQSGGSVGNYLAATAAIDGQQYEILYVLDLSTRRLHAFAPTNIQTKRLEHLDERDLEADFRR